MEKELVPHDIALALKEIGFNEPCYATYTDNSGGDSFGIILHLKNRPKSNSDLKHLNTLPSGEGLFIGINEKGCAAPLYQQAFTWFREEHDLFSEISFRDGSFCAYIGELTSVDFIPDYSYSLETQDFNEAQKDCLRKLIEILKKWNKNLYHIKKQ